MANPWEEYAPSGAAPVSSSPTDVNVNGFGMPDAIKQASPSGPWSEYQTGTDVVSRNIPKIQPGVSRFASNLWDKSIGSMIPMLKRAVGYEELDKAHEAIKNGDYANAGSSLFNWATGTPATRIADTVIDSAKATGQHVYDEAANAGKALKEGRLEDAVVHGATALFPTRADQVKKAVDAVKAGHAPDAIAHIAAAASGDEDAATMANSAEQMRSGDVAGGLGSALGPVVNAGLAAAGGAVPGESAVALRPVSSGLTAEEQAAVNFAHERGIPLSAATETGNKFVQSAQKVAASQPLGAGVSKAASEATRDALVKTGQSLVEIPTTEEAAGNSVASALEAKRASHAAGAREAYSRLEQIENDPTNTQTVKTGERTINTGVLDESGNPVTRTESITKDIAVPVDMTPVIKSLRPIYDKLSEELPIAQRQASPGFTAIKNIVEGDTMVPASVAEANLGAVKQIQRETVSPKSKFLAGQAVDAMRPVVDDAVSAAGDDAISALREGRALTKAKYATQATIDQLPTEPVKLFNKLTANEDTNINLLRDVQSKAPGSMPALGRAVLQGLVDSATASEGARPGTAFTNWNKIGDATKQILFPDPVARKGIDNFFTLAKKVAENPNPSGSAVVAYSMAPAGLMIHNPVAATATLLSGYGVAKLLNSPTGVRLLTEGMKVPLKTPAVAAGIAAQITKMAGTDAKPFLLPKAAKNEGSQPQYSEGQAVRLANGDTVTIKKINGEGTFDY